jgi:hypothetical protein
MKRGDEGIKTFIVRASDVWRKACMAYLSFAILLITSESIALTLGINTYGNAITRTIRELSTAFGPSHLKGFTWQTFAMRDTSICGGFLKKREMRLVYQNHQTITSETATKYNGFGLHCTK